MLLKCGHTQRHFCQMRPSTSCCQDKGQRAQTEAEKVPAEDEEELLHSEGDGALAQAA